MATTQKINFLTLVSYSLLQTVLATIQNVTDRQTADKTTDRLVTMGCPTFTPRLRLPLSPSTISAPI